MDSIKNLLAGMKIDTSDVCRLNERTKFENRKNGWLRKLMSAPSVDDGVLLWKKFSGAHSRHGSMCLKMR